MAATTPDDDDPRYMELETLEAIFPEIRRPDDASGFVFDLELPVRPAEPVTVLFPAASAAPDDGQPAAASPASSSTSAPVAAPVAEPVDSLLVSHLPPVSLRIVLPDGYPADKPPVISISTTPQWLSRETLAGLEADGPRLWDEAGRDLVAYSYIDHVHRAAEDVFGAITPEGTLAVPPEHKLAVLDYDIKAKRAAFEKETFECGVCLVDPKKGSKCHKMLDCGHIFCLQCLQDFYNGAITEGNLSTVRCLTPNCAKDRAATAAGAAPAAEDSAALRRKAKTFISPSELLQIGLSDDTVRRYVTLKYKTELESDKETIYCPRQWCSGAARSKKHKKPEGLEFSEASSDREDDADVDPTDEKAAEERNKKKKFTKFNAADLLSVCEDCGFAFCSRCFQTWHGEFFTCVPRRTNGELTEEDKASLEYLKKHTSPCPTCDAPAQKTHGCNHMICSRCDTHFCYLCSSWLDPGNPYKHYNEEADGRVTSCYMRLWELEGGDGHDAGIGVADRMRAVADHDNGHDFGGDFIDGHWDPADEDNGQWEVVQDSESDDSDDETEDGNAPPNGQPQIAVAREAPLVLRLVDNQHRPGGRRAARDGHPAAQQQPAPPAARGRGGHNHNQHRHQHQHQQGPHRGGARGAGARGGGGGRGQAPQRGVRGGAPRGGGGRVARGGNAGRAAGRGGGAAAVAAAAAPEHQLQQQQQAGGNNGAGLDAAQEAWVRRFVQMALLDEEDQVEGGDSDSDDGNWHIR
ncbi:RING finger protein [Purpureocillium lavendulum]|uniref:RBR-type E3 ubiquitin transferase n=1 Tax=Purpureocillium lavendulum TaxID=1247861 RepID=A0AB34FHR9_9HYPO|nr:RING finger protein [Purpureocillium lavendulum]